MQCFQLSSSDKAQVGVIFYLDELTDVSEESEDEVKYVTYLSPKSGVTLKFVVGLDVSM